MLSVLGERLAKEILDDANDGIRHWRDFRREATLDGAVLAYDELEEVPLGLAERHGEKVIELRASDDGLL